MSAAKVIEILWSAQRPLSDKDLESLTDASEPLVMNLASIAETMEGIACLVGEDETGGRTGTFQTGESVFEMLCGFSASISAISSAIFVTNEAQAIRRERLKRQQINCGN